MEDPLKVLGLSPGCTLADVRERYRVLCVKYHPDKNTGQEETFKAISEAYRRLRSEPLLLSTSVSGGPVSYLDGIVELDLKDFYYASERAIKVQRTHLCEACSGTGSKNGQAGVCKSCGGEGTIESSALFILGTDGTCQVCKGTGIVGDPCPVCRGEKKIEESVQASFRATLHVYYKRCALIPGFGNGRSDGTYEDLMVKVSIKEDPYVIIESNYFKVCVNITPSQRAIGDHCILDIFGRKVPYVIRPGESETYVTDGIRPGFSRTVRVIFKEYVPMDVRETAELYERAKQIEKKSFSAFGSKVPTSSWEPGTQPRQPT